MRHLLCREGWYYYRRRVPADVSRWFPGSEIKISLKTRSLKIAKRLAVIKDGQIEELFFRVRANIFDQGQLQAVLGKMTIVEGQGSKLKESLQEFLREKQPSLATRTRDEYEIRAGSVLKLLGDRHLQSVTRDDLVSLRDKLALKLAPATVNKYLSWLKTFFSWCQSSGRLDMSPADGIVRMKDNGKRERYTVEELSRLVARVSEFHQSDSHPERYWVPLICLFMGLRLTEAMELRKRDLIEVDGIWCLRLSSSEGKELKSKSSERTIPVHPELLKRGFSQYVETKTERLWPSIERLKPKSGRVSNSFTCWYSQQVNPVVTAEKNKSFHSLRHAFADTLKQAEIEEQVIAELLGHSRGSITMERYGKKYRPEVLLRAITNIQYDL